MIHVLNIVAKDFQGPPNIIYIYIYASYLEIKWDCGKIILSVNSEFEFSLQWYLISLLRVIFLPQYSNTGI